MSSTPSPADLLRVDVERHGNATIVKLTGSANMEASTDLRDRLIELVDEHISRLILDLSDLAFICSVGLGGIIAAHLRCRHNDAEVILVAPRPAITELLDVTKLNKLFRVYDSVESAITGH